MRIGIIGNGRLGQALARGLSRNRAQDIFVAFRNGARTLDIPGVSLVRELPAVDLVILAVKPQDVASALAQHQARIGPVPLVSAAAGVRLQTLMEITGGDQPVVRAMPNICAVVGASVTCLCYGYEDPELVGKVTAVFEQLGSILTLPREWETQLDAVTAVSGSGPAYVFEMMAALTDAGITLGLDPLLAYRLAAETARGAAMMALDQAQTSWAELVRQVASPGGTTEAALSVLRDGDWNGVLARAISAAALRSRSLG